MPADKQLHLLGLINKVKELINPAHRPDGYNVGINNGAAAGQAVPHAHIHVIPRYAGDVEDPRGGSLSRPFQVRERNEIWAKTPRLNGCYSRIGPLSMRPRPSISESNGVRYPALRLLWHPYNPLNPRSGRFYMIKRLPTNF